MPYGGRSGSGSGDNIFPPGGSGYGSGDKVFSPGYSGSGSGENIPGGDPKGLA